MFTSFSTALSALNATSTAIDVVGNNLANMNSPGFKTSAVCFRDLVTQSLGAGLGDTQVGFGTGTPLTIRQFTQGAIQTSAGLLDAAVQGDGFFVIEDAGGNQKFTRAGNFQADKDGNLLTDIGEKVQGWTTLDPLTKHVVTNGPVGNIIVPVGSLKAPTPTSLFTVDLNLNSSAAVGTTSDFSAPMKVFDSLGTTHVVTLSFEKTDANTWHYSVNMAPEDLVDPTLSKVTEGDLKFNDNGQLIEPAAGTIDFATPELVDGAHSGDITK